jgi:hypothetical protein
VNWSNANNCEHVSVFIRQPQRYRLAQSQKVAQVAEQPDRARPQLDLGTIDRRRVFAR